MKIDLVLVSILTSTLCIGCLTADPDGEDRAAGEASGEGAPALGEAESALACCDEPYTVVSYRYTNECRLDDLTGRNELWRVEYQIVDTHQVCCCVDRIISHEETEIYAANTGNTSTCPQ